MQARPRYRLLHVTSRPRPMIGLSVAVGRFVEALFWAILRVVGMVSGAVIGGAVVVMVVALVARAWWRRR